MSTDNDSPLNGKQENNYCEKPNTSSKTSGKTATKTPSETTTKTSTKTPTKTPSETTTKTSTKTPTDEGGRGNNSQSDYPSESNHASKESPIPPFSRESNNHPPYSEGVQMKDMDLCVRPEDKKWVHGDRQIEWVKETMRSTPIGEIFVITDKRILTYQKVSEYEIRLIRAIDTGDQNHQHAAFTCTCEAAGVKVHDDSYTIQSTDPAIPYIIEKRELYEEEQKRIEAERAKYSMEVA